jgi:hypothetical protein
MPIINLYSDLALTAPEMLICRTRGDAHWDLYPAEIKRTANLERRKKNNEAI